MRVAVSRFLVLIGCLLKLMGPQQSHLPYTPASSPCQAKGLWGGDSAWYWMEQTAARPKNGHLYGQTESLPALERIASELQKTRGRRKLFRNETSASLYPLDPLW